MVVYFLLFDKNEATLLKNAFKFLLENDPVWRKIIWSPNKKLLVADFDLNIQGLIFCTLQGLCYKAHFQKSKSGSPTLNGINSYFEEN